ncbi:hypothetical protein K3495_g2741 [Podosphaera aphanis]|nr:hypothetical protein K3495_g2741 [Podosphaera aphanis]
MYFQYLHANILSLVILIVASAGASDHKSTPPSESAKSCTISSATGAFYDLNELKITPLKDDKPPPKGVRVDDWKARGYDYHDNQANFTMNICGAISAKQSGFEGVEQSLWQNVSAYYQLGPKKFSIGQESSTLQLRGRRLVLEYRNGSPCGNQNPSLRRKSSLISFHCDKDPLAAQSSGIVTYVGNLDDECSYHFEVLSKVACARAEPAKQSLGPGAVFAVIGLIAILVYFLGGIFYQRNVAHARDWRQLPNYSMWAGIGSFIKDIFTNVISFCARFVPRRQGYTALSNGYSRGRLSEDENCLIDHLDEEWDD